MLVHTGLAVHFIFAGFYLRYGLTINTKEAAKRIKEAGGTTNAIQFLTIWALFLQMYFYGISTVNDLFGNIYLVQILIDYAFAALIFPVSTFVTFMFWSLVRYDPHTIFEGNLNDVLPSWLNHSIHTIPAIGVVLEAIVYPHVYPAKITGITTVLIFAAAYITCCVYSATLSGTWAYPFLNKLSVLTRSMFFVASLLLLTVCYLCGEAINYIVW